MFHNLAHRARHAADDTPGTGGALETAVRHGAAQGDAQETSTQWGMPAPAAPPTDVFGPSEYQEEKERRQRERQREDKQPSALAADKGPSLAPLQRVITRDSSWFLAQSSSPFHTIPPRRQKKPKFVKMDLSTFQAEPPAAATDDDMESPCVSDAAVDGSNDGHESNCLHYYTEPLPSDTMYGETSPDDYDIYDQVGASLRMIKRRSDGQGLRTARGRIGRPRRNAMEGYLMSRPRPAARADSSTDAASPRTNRFRRQAASSPSNRGVRRIPPRRICPTSAMSIDLHNRRLPTRRLMYSESSAQGAKRPSAATALSMATTEAFPALMEESGEYPETEAEANRTLSKEAVWAALQSLPGFTFPPLDVFLSHHHPWMASDANGNDNENGNEMDNDDTESRIQSINGVLPLGRRATALDRLARVLSAPRIVQACGRSLDRTRLPNFLKYSLEQQGRVCAAEAREVGRALYQGSIGISASSQANAESMEGMEGVGGKTLRIVDTIEDALAGRFRLGYLSAMASSSASADMDIDFSAVSNPAPSTPTHVDGRLVALVLADMVSILTSARSHPMLSGTSAGTSSGTSSGKASGKASQRPSRAQRQVLPALRNAVHAVEALQQATRELQQRQAAAQGEAAMEVDLFAGLKL